LLYFFRLLALLTHSHVVKQRSELPKYHKLPTHNHSATEAAGLPTWGFFKSLCNRWGFSFLFL